mmetsp:Transcript_39399/g.116840  ORF Transcript_39399/g.116840 Transcript_39399/m.116840 type:complete len:246 (-) Transcript_39399:1379-2116(-)
MVRPEPDDEPLGRALRGEGHAAGRAEARGAGRDRQPGAHLRAHRVGGVRRHADRGPARLPRLRAGLWQAGSRRQDRCAGRDLHARQAQRDALRGAGRGRRDDVHAAEVPKVGPELRAHGPHPEQARQVLQRPDDGQREQVDRGLWRAAGEPGSLRPDAPLLAGRRAAPQELQRAKGGHERRGPEANAVEGPQREVHAERGLQGVRLLHGAEDREHVRRSHRTGPVQPQGPENLGREDGEGVGHRV